MPRVNSMRSLANETNLARRIAFEREQRGWSYEGLAKRMAAAGYPIQSTAIFKIERGKPPRRVTVDELVGFAAAFDVTVEEMLVPVELIHDRRALELHQEQVRLYGQLRKTAVGMYDAQRELLALGSTSTGAAADARAKMRLFTDAAKLLPPGHTMVDLEQAEKDAESTWPAPVRRAAESLWNAIGRWAKEAS